MVSAKVEFRYESIKSKFCLIHFVSKLMIESSLKILKKIIRENAFEQKKKKPVLI